MWRACGASDGQNINKVINMMKCKYLNASFFPIS